MTTAPRPVANFRYGVSARRSGPGSAISDDHLPFKSLRVPVIDLIDLNYGGPTRAFWHTDKDTLDKCSSESLQIIGDIVCGALPKIEDEILKRKR